MRPEPKRASIQLNNYPNPFSNSTELSFELAQQERVAVSIYNVAGQKARSIDKDSPPPGKHSIVWDGKDDGGQRLASGIYFYTVQTSRGVSTRKTVLVE
jgi:flagellar hook assembly protein FlgD